MNITTCQICGRAIKAGSGVIAHHGYKRPFEGYQTRSCEGAHAFPYEQSREAIPPVLARVKEYLARREGQLANHIAEPPASLSYQRTDAYGKPLGALQTCTRPEGWKAPAKAEGSYNPNTYDGQHSRIRWQIQRDITGAKSFASHLERRYADQPAYVAKLKEGNG